MDSAELSEWMAFDNVYGIPDGYFVAGLVCSTLAGVFGRRKGKPPTAGDFVPFFAPHKDAQTVADHKAIFRRLAGLDGDRDP